MKIYGSGSFCYYILFCTSLFSLTQCHSCGHKSPLPTEVVHGVHLEPHSVMKRRAIDQALRIHLYYDASINSLPYEQQDLIKNDLIPSTVPYWEQTLQVRHTENAIKLQRKCIGNTVKYKSSGDPHPYCAEGCLSITKCGETEVPAEHLDLCRQWLDGGEFEDLGTSGLGVANTDFILYVSAHNTARCNVGTTVAYSAYCQQETAFDRPVAGYVNLCPKDISTKLHDLDQMHSTMRHEILHALGFSVGLFAFFRDDEGRPLTPRNSMNLPHFNSELEVYQWSERIIRKVTRRNWSVRTGSITKEINVMVTPRVVEEVRRHFNCSTLEGAELEDQDAIGTALSHWEKRIFENEAMTGGYTQNPIISRLTLALMEDSGWYLADYSMAEDLLWGANLGCEFAQNSCLHWMQSQRAKNESIHPFCDRLKNGESLYTECTDDRTAVAVCNLAEFDGELLSQYQYFDEIEGVDGSEVGRYAGSVVLADYCPFIQEFNWKNDVGVTVRTSTCLLESDILLSKNYILEKFGPKSRCFEHREPWAIQHCEVKHVVDNWGSGCYEMRCDEQFGLILILDGREYQCLNAGDVIHIHHGTSEWYHTGTIICPECSLYCKDQLESCPAKPAILAKSESHIKHADIPCRYFNHSMTSFTNGLLLCLISIILSCIYTL